MAEKLGGDFSSSWVASGDMSTNQYRFVTNVGLTANDKRVFIPTSGTFTLGVQQNKPKNNEHVGVIQGGWTKVQLAGSLGPQVEIQAGANGAATIALSGNLTGWAAGWIPCGGNSGEIVPAYIQIRKLGQ